jgi:hypothetical protein
MSGRNEAIRRNVEGGFFLARNKVMTDHTSRIKPLASKTVLQIGATSNGGAG